MKFLRHTLELINMLPLILLVCMMVTVIGEEQDREDSHYLLPAYVFEDVGGDVNEVGNSHDTSEKLVKNKKKVPSMVRKKKKSPSMVKKRKRAPPGPSFPANNGMKIYDYPQTNPYYPPQFYYRPQYVQPPFYPLWPPMYPYNRFW